MSSKTALQNGGKKVLADAIEEVPSVSAGMPQNSPAQNETEVEEIEGYSFFKPSEADREVYNRVATESGEETETETGLEDTGSAESGGGEEGFVLDAFFASYNELLPEAKMMMEIILGVDNRVRINPTTAFPWRAICGLKITAKNGSKWIGTGWMVSPRTIITAGHCVFMHDQGGWAKSIEVIPALNDATRPYGSAVATTFRSVTGWTGSKSREHDYGAIILPANSRLGDRTGYFGYGVKDDAYLRASVLNLSGYPGDKGGNQQWFMAMKPKSVSSRIITYEIDTMGGQSGAPVWLKVGDTRTVVGIHTNGHSTGNSATRIVTAVFNNIKTWKNLGM